MDGSAEFHPLSPPAERGAGGFFSRLVRLAPVKGLSTVCDQFLVSGASFAASVIIGRLTPPESSKETLGVYALALSVVLFLRGVQGELVNSPYTVHCHRRAPEERPAYTGSILIHQVGLSVVGMAVMAVLAFLCGLGQGPAGLAAPVFAVLVGVLPFLMLRECLRQASLAQFRVGAVLSLDAVTGVLQVTGLLLLAYFDLLTLPAVFAAVGAACAVGCAIWFFTGRLPIRFVPGQVKADWLRNWSFGKWTLACFLLYTTSPSLVPWILSATHDEAAVGLLAACSTLVNLAGVYITGASNFLVPQAARAFAEGGLPELRGVLQRTALFFVVPLSGFCLVVFWTGDLATRLVYGTHFEGTSAILIVLSLGMLINSVGTTAGAGLWALNRPEANVAADGCSLLVTLSAVLLLVSPLGVLGASLALLGGICAGTVVRWLTLGRCIRVITAASSPVGGPAA